MNFALKEVIVGPKEMLPVLATVLLTPRIEKVVLTAVSGPQFSDTKAEIGPLKALIVPSPSPFPPTSQKQ